MRRLAEPDRQGAFQIDVETIIAVRPRAARVAGGSLLCLSTAACGCSGTQSALDPAGDGAETIAILFWAMAIGAAAIWCTVCGLAAYALFVAPRPHDTRSTRRWVIGGGVVVPTLVLSILLAFGLSILPMLLRPAPEESLTIEAVGARWWWKFTYETPDGGTVELANEVRLPAGEPVQFYLESADVVHGFWIPSLGGKVDMIPGRRTQLALLPRKTGTYRGVCAEYCGASHARMAFDVVVMPREEFDAWLEQQTQDAVTPSHSEAVRGAELFLAHGCGACHAVRGTDADGEIGPDLTHIGDRLSIAAGTLPNDEENLRRWIATPQSVKPEATMPGFGTLTEDELQALAAYLESLE